MIAVPWADEVPDATATIEVQDSPWLFDTNIAHARIEVTVPEIERVYGYLDDEMALAWTERIVHPRKRWAAIVPLSPAVLADQPADWIANMLAFRVDRHVRPWTYPDRPLIGWTFDPFPRWTRARRAIMRAVVHVRRRRG